MGVLALDLSMARIDDENVTAEAMTPQDAKRAASWLCWILRKADKRNTLWIEECIAKRWSIGFRAGHLRHQTATFLHTRLATSWLTDRATLSLLNGRVLSELCTTSHVSRQGAHDVSC